MRTLYEIGPLQIDPEARVLTHAGAALPLGARGVAVLTTLVSRANRYVEKSAILDAAWPGLVVEEANLAVQISAIRRALALVSGGERWIETLPRRGYRFVGPVKEVAAQSVAQRATDRRRTNLTEPLNSFVGRERELAEIKQKLPTSRLMTLTGVGGLGKTRLAQQAAAEMQDAYRDGVWFVDLAPLDDPALVPTALARLLQVKETAQQPLLSALCTHLGASEVLLILDNCEHVLEGCARMTETLLREAPRVTVLATSREALHVPGEWAYALGPLPLPDPRADSTSIARAASVQLFTERALERRPSLDLVGHRARVVAEICVRLDGIPLALELAAARVAVLPIEQILRLITERFRLLTSGDPGLPRHRTLRAMLDWSHDLLDDNEKKLFARLSVFAGGWTLDAASQVCSGEIIKNDDVVYVLIGLIEQSLVVTEENGDRYRMLETVREYSKEKLDVDERALVSERHARYLRDHFEPAFEDWVRGSDVHWNAVYLVERDNVRTALDWSFSPRGDPEIGISLTAHCGPAWLLWSLHSEGLARVELALRRRKSRTPQRIRARLWLWLGVLSQYRDSGKWVTALRRAVALHRRAGDAFGAGYSLMRLGAALARTGKLDLAQQALDASRPLLARGPVPAGMAPYFHVAGFLRKLEGDLAGAREHYEKGLVLYRAAGLSGDAMQLCGALADTNWALGALDAAADGFREVIATMRASNLGSDLVLGVNLTNLAGVLVERGDLDEALGVGREGLELRRAAGYAWGALDHFALRAALVGRWADAARLAGYVDAMFATRGVVHQANEARARARLDHLLGDRLDTDERALLMGEGATMTEEDACRLALCS